MTKKEFLDELREKISKLPCDEVEERLSFYSEMIDDSIEDGLSEEEAVNKIGNVNDIAKQIISEVPFSKLVIEKIKRSRDFSNREIILIILCAPIWFSLLIAVGAIVFSIYVSIWAIIVSLWAVFGGLVALSPYCLVVGIINIISGNLLQGVTLIGCSAIIAGLSLLLFYAIKLLTGLTMLFTKKVILYFKNLLIKKEVK